MIRVFELTKRFVSGRQEVVAVDRLSFAVHDGEAYGLLGANGAGKTTTLRMILGLLTPTSGYAEVDGVRTSESPEEVKRLVGFVSTSAGLYQWLTPRELLLYFAEAYGLSDERAAANLKRLVNLFELQEFLDRRCSVLSTGQKQRVNLARSLIHDPSVLLLDEPTRGLDVLGSQVIIEFVTQARQEGRSVVVCTHRLDEAERFCNRFGLLHAGRLLNEGTLPELQQATGCRSLTEMLLTGASRSAN